MKMFETGVKTKKSEGKGKRGRDRLLEMCKEGLGLIDDVKKTLRRGRIEVECEKGSGNEEPERKCEVEKSAAMKWMKFDIEGKR